ncbi:MAG: hypothetical protein GWM90_14760 [Gemmatimonadetes bacterium]|nr:DUF4097 domain-containing protein [Gemmatimonadota bacterium]NIQ55440.1 DUF4097 domain-containing protein [Gemmatimonadota bacterium]NIU75648.1 hypothetical protein [Gammaproteobacteria bacterium]NIX45323.1 hypothetical protein [Gemmatimonadota bacterium]NIY09606.1 hypothetical protein [Gemmatimonadota bacterium]
MRHPAVIPSLLVVALPLAAAAQTRGSRCDVRREAVRELDATSLSGVLVHAQSGTLEVTGGEADVLRVHAVICASDAGMADASRLVVEERRGAAWIETDLPDGGGWDRDYARMDLVVEMPGRLAADIRDGSGAISVRAIAGVHIDDGSGDIRVEDVDGPVELDDGSGGIRISGAASVELEDGSGSIEIADVRGPVRILEDGSGEIVIRDITGDVIIEEDGSGSIGVAGVGGDFIVRDDSSGSVSHSGVQGRVLLPRGR